MKEKKFASGIQDYKAASTWVAYLLNAGRRVGVHVKRIDVQIRNVRDDIAEASSGMNNISKGRIAIAKVKFAGEGAIGGTGEHRNVACVFDGVEIGKQQGTDDLKAGIAFIEKCTTGCRVKGRSRNQRELSGGRDAVGINATTSANHRCVECGAVSYASSVFDVTDLRLGDTGLGVHRVNRGAKGRAVAVDTDEELAGLPKNDIGVRERRASNQGAVAVQFENECIRRRAAERIAIGEIDEGAGGVRRAAVTATTGIAAGRLRTRIRRIGGRVTSAGGQAFTACDDDENSCKTNQADRTKTK